MIDKTLKALTVTKQAMRRSTLRQGRVIRIGGACGFWGESDSAVPQLLQAGGLNYIVFDYLAEVTMSILARAREREPSLGYATDFVTAVLKPNLAEIARQRVRIISNAGGLNPESCAQAVRALIEQAGLDLKVAVVTGDDILAQARKFASANIKEMFSSAPFPDPERIVSINAYLGAFPIAEALSLGADIVVTGRIVDSAVTLAACIHEFGWHREDWDKLAAGSLAGHILECGPQATGGNYTDWRLVVDNLHEIGYPIAEVSPDGSFIITKPERTGGVVTVGTVGEQILYEIGDPQTYILPDVICDFSDVKIETVGVDRVRVSGAKGRPAPSCCKASATYLDGWRSGTVLFFYGEDASSKARAFAESGFQRARRKLFAANLPDFDDTLVEVIGDESQYGDFANSTVSREVAIKIAAKHVDQRGAALLLKELTGLGLSSPPGLCGFSGSRPKPSPIVRLFSFLVPKSTMQISVSFDDQSKTMREDFDRPATVRPINRALPPPVPIRGSVDCVEVPLIRLAFARSGDKGNNANIGVLPRREEYAAWIWSELTEHKVAGIFSQFLRGEVERFYLPGMGGINFLLHDVLGGGGVASLRNDPQGKSYAQLLLQVPIPIRRDLVELL